ncbi:MAG: Succinyl-diaminopimelate desuccinylase [Pseudomonadales bacterium]|nr:Succinyl-diaminopimelate desuccinylase [Pseudomonadales bacterium]
MDAAAWPSPTLALAAELIARASITPDDAGCQQLLAARLEACGFRCTRLRYGEVQNLWAECGSGGPLLVFAGHTDVVPPGDRAAWTHPPFAPLLREGMLYGRGAADMKGSLAAMVTACERLLAGGAPAGRIAFLLTSDEEGPAVDGTRRVVEWLRERGERIDWCIVGEPSSSRSPGDTLRVGRRGSLGAELVVRGVQGHVAYPERARNPVHQALAALAELAATRWDEGNAHFPPTSLQISDIHAGNGATNVIPGELRVLFNLRFGTASDADALMRRIGELFTRHALEHELVWHRHGEPFLTAGGELLTAATEAIVASGAPPPELSTGGGTSDGRFIAPLGCQVIELGPCNATIHKVDECVGAAELDALSALYEAIMRRLGLGGNS